jgi:recombination protein RecT
MATDAAAAKSTETKAAAPAVPAKQETHLQLIKRSVVDVVKGKIDQFIASGELFVPKDYSPDNAMKAAWLILQSTVDKDGRPALEVCTRDSVANSLLDMVVQGLNPMKKQNYFIVYGKTLTCQRSYFGSMAVAQMVNPKIAEFSYAVVYEDDIFKYGIKNGKKAVTEHEQELKNIDKKKIVAAYCMALDKEGNPLRAEIMTFEEILQAWKQSKMNPIDDQGKVKSSSTHGKFSSDMALKTVINKTCKSIINASSDNALLLEQINRTEDLTDRAEAEIEIEESANKGPTLEIEAGKAVETETVAGDAQPETEEKAPAPEAKRGPSF